VCHQEPSGEVHRTANDPTISINRFNEPPIVRQSSLHAPYTAQFFSWNELGGIVGQNSDAKPVGSCRNCSNRDVLGDKNTTPSNFSKLNSIMIGILDSRPVEDFRAQIDPGVVGGGYKLNLINPFERNLEFDEVAADLNFLGDLTEIRLEQ